MKQHQTAAFATLALTLGIAAFSSAMTLPDVTKALAANSHVHCTGYANKAVKLFKRYRAKGGTRTNNVWNGSYTRHFSHCRNAPPNLTSWLQSLRYDTLSSGRF